MSFGYSSRMAWALGMLSTYKECLPQGAPSSPLISNIVCRGLDARLYGLCKSRGWDYTRYCDDITISGNTNISMNTQNLIREIIEGEGFRVNKRKVYIARRNRRQMVTGLVVNEKIALPRYKRKIWRAIFKQAELEPERHVDRLDVLRGYLAYLNMVQNKSKEINRYREVIEKIEQSVESV